MVADALVGVPKPGDVIADKYMLVRVLGKGAAGVVYEATHELIGRRVAIKWLYPQLAQNEVTSQRFLREAKAANAVDHPNVVEIYDAGRHDESLYLVMEHLRGESFSKYIERGPADPTDLVGILMPALRGVAAAHDRGVIHRDLKPDNIFLCAPRRGRPGGAKVLDFGISKLLDIEPSLTLTSAGTYLGSPYYMAPEQIADSSTVDERADVYSIGVMLYEGLTGRVPFDSESLSGLFFKITNDVPELISDFRSDVAEGLESVVMRAMSARPEDRFASIHELALALEPFAGGAVFETLDEAMGEALGERRGKRGGKPDTMRDIGSVRDLGTMRDIQPLAELERAPTQISREGAMTYDTLPPGDEERATPVDPDAEAIVAEATARPAERPYVPRPPPPSSRAAKTLRGLPSPDLEASPTKPLIMPDAVDGAPGTDPAARDPGRPASPGLSNARTMRLEKPAAAATQRDLARIGAATYQMPAAPAAPSAGPRIPWVAVVSASLVIAVLTAVAVLALR